jgi:hypothetical protein
VKSAALWQRLFLPACPNNVLLGARNESRNRRQCKTEKRERGKRRSMQEDNKRQASTDSHQLSAFTPAFSFPFSILPLSPLLHWRRLLQAGTSLVPQGPTPRKGSCAQTFPNVSLEN